MMLPGHLGMTLKKAPTDWGNLRLSANRTDAWGWWQSPFRGHLQPDGLGEAQRHHPDGLWFLPWPVYFAAQLSAIYTQAWGSPQTLKLWVS